MRRLDNGTSIESSGYSIMSNEITVVVLSCASKDYWYSGKEGKEFLVYRELEKFDDEFCYRLVNDNKLIDIGDAEVVCS